MSNFQNQIKLRSKISRVQFRCTVHGISQIALFDPGSPNTVINLELARALGLKSYRSGMAKIHISGSTIDVVPVTLPELTMGSLNLTNVRAYAGLGKSWGNTVLLGLNVLNHLVYTVDRSEGSGFINLELNQAGTISEQDIFNRLISTDGKYYVTDEEVL